MTLTVPQKFARDEPLTEDELRELREVVIEAAIWGLQIGRDRRRLESQARYWLKKSGVRYRLRRQRDGTYCVADHIGVPQGFPFEATIEEVIAFARARASG